MEYPWRNRQLQALIGRVAKAECNCSTADLAAPRDQIASLRPDTILVEEGESGVPREALGILQVCSWKVCFVGLGLADNELRVYHGEQRRVRKADDLLHLIRGN